MKARSPSTCSMAPPLFTAITSASTTPSSLCTTLTCAGGAGAAQRAELVRREAVRRRVGIGTAKIGVIGGATGVSEALSAVRAQCRQPSAGGGCRVWLSSSNGETVSSVQLKIPGFCQIQELEGEQELPSGTHGFDSD